jgi:hypothetical protein
MVVLRLEFNVAVIITCGDRTMTVQCFGTVLALCAFSNRLLYHTRLPLHPSTDLNWDHLCSPLRDADAPKVFTRRPTIIASGSCQLRSWPDSGGVRFMDTPSRNAAARAAGL